jgi:PGF-CTERM protein
MTDIRRLTLFVALVGVLFLTACVGSVAAQSAPDCSTVSYNGDGTEANPYEVGNVDQLQCIEEQGLSANYVQVSDIGASGTSEWNGGRGFEPIGEFTVPTFPDRTRDTEFRGTFDGGNYTVSELTIDRGDTNFVGLFGGVESALLENVSLNNINITGNEGVGGLTGVNINGTVTESYATGTVSGDASGNEDVGALVGKNSGTVTDSYATGSVNGDRDAGGLVGENNDGTVGRSYATGSVSGDNDVGGLVGGNDAVVKNSYATGSVNGEDLVGGLVGRSAGTVEKSYATGDVSGNDRVGGLVGANTLDGTVRESYASGSVSGDENVGGLVGEKVDGTITESYWDTESTGQFTSAGGATGLTTSEMTGDAAANNMRGFDFTSTWETVDGDYPKLSWQSDGGTDGSSDNGESGSSDGAEGKGLPGFTVVTAVLAVLTVAAAVRRREEG